MKTLNNSFERPAIHPLAIIMNMVFLLMEFLECLQVLEEVDLFLKIPVTLPLAIVEFIIMVIKVVKMEEVGIGIKTPSTLPLEIL